MVNRAKIKQHNRNILWLSMINIALSLLIISCEENKAVQCKPIFLIARQVTTNFQDINSGDQKQSGTPHYWLSAASQFNSAADKIQALKIDNSQLIQYQNQLAAVYRIYAQATYDAVRARENKNLGALEAASQDANQADKMQQDLIQEINAFCLD